MMTQRKRPDTFNLGKLLEEVIGKSLTLKVDAGQVIFAQGNVADDVCYVQDGQVKLTVVSKAGKEAVIALVGKGEFFGEGCLADQAVRVATARAMEKTTILRAKKEIMMKLLHDEPEYSAHFVDYLLARNIRFESDLVDQLFNSSEKRLARLLLLLTHYGKDMKPTAVVPKLSQETLAEMIGTTRSRVSFFMNKFRKLGFIDYNDGGLYINTALLSVVLTDNF